MSKKGSTLILITFIYTFTISIGIIVYLLLPELALGYRMLIANVSATFLIWIFSLIFKNASIYDPYWSVIPPLIILGSMIAYQNFDLNMVLLLSAICIWAFRLTYNWALLWTDFSHQDWRYIRIKNKSPKIYILSSLVGIMMMPTLIVFLQLITSIKLAAVSHQATWLSVAGFLMIILATLIQLVADTQMQNFKKNQSVKGTIINQGLWKYSRHPNYLGEIMVWWGLYLFYVDAFGFDYYIVAPLSMMSLFIFISIPMMEKKILETRPHYKDYQKHVSPLFPFKRGMKD